MKSTNKFNIPVNTEGNHYIENSIDHYINNTIIYRYFRQVSKSRIISLDGIYPIFTGIHIDIKYYNNNNNNNNNNE